MLNIIVELSKYLLLILIILYAFQCFTVFKRRTEEKKKKVLYKQFTMILLLEGCGFLILFLNTMDWKIAALFGAIVLFFSIIQILYRLIYPKASLLVVNNMCMLLAVGFLILTRLDYEEAVKQFIIAAGATVIAFIIPVIIRKLKVLSRLTWLYGVLGMICLGIVLVLAQMSGGAKLSISVGGITIQFSELVKITFVFFVASILAVDRTFKKIVIATVVAAAHVGILVLSTDLGTALVFFITYLVMLYVATKKLRYAAAGLAAGGGAAVAAYFLFNHVRQRVVAWKDPFAVYQTSGYQIVQSLFAIGAGGWFGMGLGQGSPTTIPVASRDFVFAAICEELGGVFAICLILICMSMFLMIVNISMQIKNPFYKLVALGLGTEYAFQVFLTIGGVTKFIPMTGITLPLVSYGGSSVMSTIIMLAIVQGLYILREDEGEQLEKERQERMEREEGRGKEISQRTAGKR
ncbi:MAG: FtsW/RodA/SpoVE family cell cycle protein [Lachnospiraceae bacterium]|nr:FtsW/RodA/SpoVE family cell cycle protein [Lachnospiraceae bacterium]